MEFTNNKNLGFAVVYNDVVGIYYATFKHNGRHIHALWDYSLEKLELKVSDYCANENVAREDIAIESGYIPGEPTNHRVYSRSNWIE